MLKPHPEKEFPSKKEKLKKSRDYDMNMKEQSKAQSFPVFPKQIGLVCMRTSCQDNLKE